MRFAGLALVLAFIASALGAQSPGAESFVRQTLQVMPFHHETDRREGLRLAGEMRGALLRAADRRQLNVVDSDSAVRVLAVGGLQRPELARDQEVGWVTRISRADEVLRADVRSRGDTLVVRATLSLVRDPRMREPLPLVRGVGRDAAATALARAVVRARAQMDLLRSCENHARDGRFDAAARAATQAIARYPDALLARTCLMRVAATQSVPADSVIRLAEWILARDSVSIIATTLRAQAITAIARAARGDAAAARSRAVAAWGRVLALRPDSADLGAEAVETFLTLSRPRDALATLDSVDHLNPSEIRYPRLRFRALHTLARWPEAAALGDSLERVDLGFSGDPNYALRYIEALAMRGDTIRAVAKSARSVTEHPQEGRLYVQYVELISGENAAALTRGLARFPSLAPLRVVAAQRARARGDAGAERNALSQALVADASLGPAYLRLAELWFQEGRPDSALVVLAQAPRSGEGTMMLRTYLVGRGLEALRGAVDSVPGTYTHAVAFLALADSVDSGEDSRSLLVAATLQQARAHLVVGASGRQCDPIRIADSDLVLAGRFLERGVGQGSAATELHEAHAGLRSAVDEAARVLCSSAG